MAVPKLKKIGKYEVLDVLGKGGMGVVYKAIDPSIGRMVAIKMITSNFGDTPSLLKRFYREAQATGKLQHPNIVIVHDLGDQDGNPFLVMEFLEGESLDSVIKSRRQLSLIEKLNLIIQVCNGLYYAHQRNIVHRDIKPANLMVLSDGVVKVVDFGVARIENDNVTVPGQVLGSIHYMSPEQINGAHLDCRTDVFSTGVVLYQLLTYTLPFEGKDTGSTLLKIINDPPPPLQQFLEVYPPELDDVVQRALAKRAEDRYQTAEEFAFDLSQVQEELKRAAASEYLRAAEDMLARAELNKARDQCLQVLKVDRQNTRAKELLRDVQTLVQKQQRCEQARQLRSLADEAIASKQLDPALRYLQQAVELDTWDTELVKLRDSIAGMKARQQQFQEVLHRAESAHYAGEFQTALEAIEQAVAIDPSDNYAATLHARITREIEEHHRQLQIQGFVEEAQRRISSRHFTAAVEALQKASELDPDAPAVRELMTLASTGREQERRRREVEQLTATIEEALNRDDYRAACEQSDLALQKFPEERGLKKLKALAEKQRQAGEKRLFVDEQISAARTLLQRGETESALATLEAACKRFPSEPALVSLLTAVRENLAQERAEARKNEYIQRAKDALRRKNFDEAIQVLTTGRDELNAPELDDLLQFAHEESAAFASRRRVEAAAEEAQRLMAAEEYKAAVDFLRTTLEEVADEELEIILADAERHIEDFNRRVYEAVNNGERLLRADRVSEALRYLESQPEALNRSQQFRELRERARKLQERLQAVATAVDQARSALKSCEYANALQTVEECVHEHGEHAELTRMKEQVEHDRNDAANTAVGKAAADARTLLLGRSFEAAVQRLDDVAALVEFASLDIRLRYQVMREEAERGIARSRPETAMLEARTASQNASEDDTHQQTEWAVPGQAITHSTDSGALRGRDLTELNQLRYNAQATTNCDELAALSARARLLAQRHPEDMEVQSTATSVAATADLRVLQLQAGSRADVHAEQPQMSATSSLTSAQYSAPSSSAQYSVPSRTDALTAQNSVPLQMPVENTASVASSDFALAAGAENMSRGTSSYASPAPETVSPPAAEKRAPLPLLFPSPAEKEPRPPREYGPMFAAALTIVVVVIAGLAYKFWPSHGKAAVPGAKTVIVKSEPSGATVRVDQQNCVTPNCRLQLAPGDYQMQTSLTGYAPDARALHIDASAEPPSLEIALTPLANVLRIDTNFSSGAAVLDGKPVGDLKAGQLKLDQIAPGQHMLSVSGPEGKAQVGFETTVARAPALTTPIDAEGLSAAVVLSFGDKAHLACNCAQPTKLALDGQQMGNIEAAGKDLEIKPGAQHQLELGDGDAPLAHLVSSEAAPTVNIFLNAEREVGTLVVETGVENATVYVDGKKYGQTANDGILRTLLPVKNVSVKVSKSGYHTPPARTAQISKNRETGVIFEMMSIKSYVSIVKGQPDASVAVDGKAVGFIRDDGTFTFEFEPGDHTIEILKSGFQTKKLAGDFDPGETVRVSGDMVPEKQTRDSNQARSNNAPSSSKPAAVAPPKGEQTTSSSNSTTSTTPATPGNSPSQEASKPANAPPKQEPSRQAAQATGPSAEDLARKAEQDDWQRVKNSKDGAQLQAFLDRYGSGAYADQARERLRDLAMDSERTAVMTTLKRYVAAYDHRNVEEIDAVYPSLSKQDRKKIAQAFKDAEGVKLDLKPVTAVTLSGDTASIVCSRSIDFSFSGKVEKPMEDTVTIKLRKQSGSWIIEAII